jgi:hypothetical protein
MSALFVYEPDLIAHIAELLQSDNGVPNQVQTAAITASDISRTLLNTAVSLDLVRFL